MILLGKIESTSWSFVGFVGFAKFGILAQLVVHFLVERVGKSSGRLTAYIYCMISTIDLVYFSSTSQLDADLFFLSFWYLNTCFSLVLL
jgi:hypothetical protein